MYNCSLEGMCPSNSIVQDKQQTSAFKKSIVVTPVDSVNLKTDPLSAKPAKMAVSLLRAALNGESYSGKALKGATEADWRAMAEIVGQSSVSAIITEALPPDEIKNIPFDVLKELSPKICFSHFFYISLHKKINCKKKERNRIYA